jgi:hypothetical protein
VSDYLQPHAGSEVRRRNGSIGARSGSSDIPQNPAWVGRVSTPSFSLFIEDSVQFVLAGDSSEANGSATLVQDEVSLGLQFWFR